MSLFESASLVVTPNGTKASKLYAIKPTDGSGDLTVTRATTATRVNASGLISSVASNVPRLDYTNSTCPSILVEPQRTNLLTYSEEFDNIAWSKFSSTVTTNSVISPDGTQNADTVTFTGNIGSSALRQSVILTIGSTYTFSIYARTPSGTGTMSVDLGDGTNVTKTINSSWNRYTFTLVAGAFPHIDISSTTASTYYIWGAQLELASYPTSYIPTTSASVTRNADVISKTGISSLIGQTEGTIFLDFVARGGDVNQEILGVTLSGGGSEYIALYSLTNGALYFATNLTGGVLIDASSFGERFKVAYSFNSGNHVLYVNGVQIYSSLISGVYSLLNAFYLGANAVGAGQQLLNTNSSALWKTRLSNTELATLTTI